MPNNLDEKAIISMPLENIVSRIFLLRGKKVMFDRDLAELYDVEAKVLNQAVKRNLERFPPDFMFQLNDQETKQFQSEILRSQFVTLKRGQHIKYKPYAFTEQGVAMLSSVLKSDRAIRVNIQIVRTFTKLREILASNKDLRAKLDSLERKYDKHISGIFSAIKKLKNWQDAREFIESEPKEPFGFRKN